MDAKGITYTSEKGWAREAEMDSQAKGGDFFRETNARESYAHKFRDGVIGKTGCCYLHSPRTAVYPSQF